jgi:hypothetical protein
MNDPQYDDWTEDLELYGWSYVSEQGAPDEDLGDDEIDDPAEDVHAEYRNAHADNWEWETFGG